jgi:hypothetical protein
MSKQSKRDWQKDWELCQAATPGPWRAEVYAQRIMPYICEHVNAADARFIAEAREAIPYWLQRVRKLETLLDKILTVCNDAGIAADGFSEDECRKLLRDIDQTWRSVLSMYLD